MQQLTRGCGLEVLFSSVFDHDMQRKRSGRNEKMEMIEVDLLEESGQG